MNKGDCNETYLLFQFDQSCAWVCEYRVQRHNLRQFWLTGCPSHVRKKGIILTRENTNAHSTVIVPCWVGRLPSSVIGLKEEPIMTSQLWFNPITCEMQANYDLRRKQVFPRFFPALCEGCGFVLSFDWVIDLFGHLFTLGEVTMEGTLKH